jgi:hypothetical protein
MVGERCVEGRDELAREYGMGAGAVMRGGTSILIFQINF